MAILDGVKNVVQGQIAARANSTIRSGLTKVAGNLLGINALNSGPNIGDPQTKAPRKQGVYDQKILSYPAVPEGEGQGHYILFNINKFDKGAVAKRREYLSAREIEDQINSEYGGGGGFGFQATGSGAGLGAVSSQNAFNRSQAEQRRVLARNHGLVGYDVSQRLDHQIMPGGDHARPNSQSIQLRFPTTVRSTTPISLYMPPSVQVAYNADYTDANIGFVADIGADIFRQIQSGNVDQMDKEYFDTALGNVGTSLEKFLLGTLDVAAPGSKAMANIIRGRVITPKMELQFNGIGRREFSYEFTFMPKSSLEWLNVKEIIKQFKLNMSPNYVEGQDYKEMELPGTFDITYMHQYGENNNMNKISTCALQSVEVAYGGDRFQAIEDELLGPTTDYGVPAQTKLNLKFREMEIITKDMIEDNY